MVFKIFIYPRFKYIYIGRVYRSLVKTVPYVNYPLGEEIIPDTNCLLDLHFPVMSSRGCGPGFSKHVLARTLGAMGI